MAIVDGEIGPMQCKSCICPGYAEISDAHEVPGTQSHCFHVYEPHSSGKHICSFSRVLDSPFLPTSINMPHQYDNPAVQQAHDRVFKEARSVPSPVLPPGFSPSQFDNLVHELADIVGVKNVHTGEALLHFSDPFSPQRDHDKYPSAAVW